MSVRLAICTARLAFSRPGDAPATDRDIQRVPATAPTGCEVLLSSAFLVAVAVGYALSSLSLASPYHFSRVGHAILCADALPAGIGTQPSEVRNRHVVGHEAETSRLVTKPQAENSCVATGPVGAC